MEILSHVAPYLCGLWREDFLILFFAVMGVWTSHLFSSVREVENKKASRMWCFDGEVGLILESRFCSHKPDSWSTGCNSQGILSS